nr:choloylglycine hydrolase family protein [Tissierella sp.]
MCTTIGFKYIEGQVFGRTLEVGVKLDNKIIYVPADTKDFIKAKGMNFPTKYAAIGSGFFNIASFGDGINEHGLMGSSNLFPGYATFSKHPVIGRLNMTTSNAFDYLLTRCKDVEEVKERAEKIVLTENGEDEKDVSTAMHFFFMDKTGKGIVLEPKEGFLIAHDNPYGVLTNSPEFSWHTTNLRNYINIKNENVEDGDFNGETLLKFGEGSGMLGLPGDFTPPSRFIRSAFFVSHTPKDLERNSAILQAFRILGQADIPTGSVIDKASGHADEALYTSIMDTKEGVYFIKYHDNINLQSFSLDDYKDEQAIKFIEIEKSMKL